MCPYISHRANPPKSKMLWRTTACFMTSRFVLDQPADDTDMQHTHLEQKILLCNESRLILMFEEVLQTFGAELGNGLSNSSTRQDPTCLTTFNHHFSGMPRRCYKHGVKDLTRPSIRISYLCSHIHSTIAVGSIQHTASCLGSGETYHFSMFKDWKMCFCIEYIPIYYIHTNWQYIYIYM